MKALARQRSHSIAFKRQVAQEFIAGESLYALYKLNLNDARSPSLAPSFLDKPHL
jgi:hypothetical protein